MRHHVPHRAIHQHEQHGDGRDQPLFQLRGFHVLERLVGGGGGFGLRALSGGAVSGLFYRLYDRLFAGGARHAHGIGQQAHGAAFHARHRQNGLFHPRAARGAAHAGHVILFRFYLFAHFITFCRSSATQVRRCCVNSTLLKLFSALLIAATCTRMSGQ